MPTVKEWRVHNSQLLYEKEKAAADRAGGRLVCLEASHGLPCFALPLFVLNQSLLLHIHNTLSFLQNALRLILSIYHTGCQIPACICSVPLMGPLHLLFFQTLQLHTLQLFLSFIQFNSLTALGQYTLKMGKEFIWASFVADPVLLPLPKTFSFLLCSLIKMGSCDGQVCGT